MARETVCLLHETTVFVYWCNVCNPSISLCIQCPPGSVKSSAVPPSTKFSIWCSDVVFRSIKCLHPYSSPLAVFLKTSRCLVLLPSQLWFMLNQRGLRQPTEVTLREAFIIRMIKKPHWAYDAIPVCRIALLQVKGSGPSWCFCPGTLRMAEPQVQSQEQKEQAGMVVPVDFSPSSEGNGKEGLGKLNYQLA